MKKDKNLLQLIGGYFSELFESIMTKREARLYKQKHGIDSENNVYFMNIVRPLGGGERMKPCEFFFESQADADLHKQVCDKCGTWEYITTVMVVSQVKLTTVNYRKMLEEDEEYSYLVEQMTNYPEIK